MSSRKGNQVMGDSLASHAGDLVLFATLIDAGSFSAAASRLGVPKSTLSRRLAALEEQLGQRLVTRTTRRLIITDFGERVLEHGRRLQEEVQAVSDLVQNEQAQPKGLLRVSLPPDLEQLDLTAMLTRYARLYPEVCVELDVSTRRVDLLADRFDLAVRIARSLPDDSTLVARKLCDIDIHLYASPRYLRAKGTPMEPADLDWHTCLRYVNSSGDVVAWPLSKGAETIIHMPKGPVASNSPQLQRDLGLAGMGIVALADSFLGDGMREGKLVRILPDWSLPSITIWCVTPGRKLLPARTRAFMKMLSKEMSS